MTEQPNFRPLKITQTSRPLTRELIASIDHIAVVVPDAAPSAVFRSLPHGNKLRQLLGKARTRNDSKRVKFRLGEDSRGTVTLTTARPTSSFSMLTWARDLVADMLRDDAHTLAISVLGFSDGDRRKLMLAFVAAAEAAAFAMPSFKSKRDPTPSARPRSLKLCGLDQRLDLTEATATALGNNVARWFAALPPNKLTAATYRTALADLAKSHGLTYEFFDERKLEKLGAGAFLAVSAGNAKRDAGIVRLSYRPTPKSRPDLALVGKGVMFDTGGTNLKPFKGMLDMHIDMQGSAVALGALITLTTLKAPYGVDAWLALTENRISATAYKPQDIVTALNGTTIQVIHTDAEGRMVLADTLALAARSEPLVMIDYATLTGTCISALTERYSGVFCSHASANDVAVRAGAESGERVWPFPMDSDYDEALSSEVADLKQCSPEGSGDHILAARFLAHFVPKTIPWIHVDLSAAQHKGGLAHVPTELTGFGVRFTQTLLAQHGNSAQALAGAIKPQND